MNLIDCLIHDDCLHAMQFIESQSIDLILTDLPFGTTRCKWDIPIDLKKLWEQYKRIVKPNAAILLFAQTPFDKILGASNLEWLRYEWIWEKSQATGHLNANKMPMKCHENILVFYKGLPIYNPQKTIGHKRKISTAAHKRNSKKTENYNQHGLTGYDSTERFPRSILKFPTDKQLNPLHSTQKPVALLEYFIKTYTNQGAIILDNTSGSGSTGEAAEKTNRHYILIENENKFISITQKRVPNILLYKKEDLIN